MGTLIAPRLRMARSVIDHSGRFSESNATRSPCLIPRSASPRAMCRTRSTKVSALKLIHFPSILWFSASALPYFKVAVRQRLGIDESAGDGIGDAASGRRGDQAMWGFRILPRIFRFSSFIFIGSCPSPCLPSPLSLSPVSPSPSPRLPVPLLPASPFSLAPRLPSHGRIFIGSPPACDLRRRLRGATAALHGRSWWPAQQAQKQKGIEVVCRVKSKSYGPERQASCQRTNGHSASESSRDSGGKSHPEQSR